MAKRKANPLLTLLKVIMLILTAVYPLTMVCLSGAGLVYNGSSYGGGMKTAGILLIVSGVLMIIGAVLSIFRRSILSVISLVCSGSGLLLCLVMLQKVMAHADSAGWKDNYTMQPISDMYQMRILPSVAPAALAVIIASLYLMSAEAALERKKRREKDNASAPSILGD